MAIISNTIDLRGKVATPVLEELFFLNNTVGQGYVTVDTDIKAESIYSEAGADVWMQPFTCGVPVSSGDTLLKDYLITPVKVQYYSEFCPENIRFSRYKTTMQPGAWNILSTEFEQVVIGGVYANAISADIENKVWYGATSATKATVAGATGVTAALKAVIAASPTTLFDSLLTKEIWIDNTASLSIKVTATTITAANIKAEYDKLFAAIPAVLLSQGDKTVYIYAPHSHRSMITIYDNNPANFKLAFAVNAGEYSFNGIQIKFVPLPENTMIAAPKEFLYIATDLESDFTTMKIDKIASNREDYFIKSIMTLATHVGNQALNVLYA
jgi:hypothetical protein